MKHATKMVRIGSMVLVVAMMAATMLGAGNAGKSLQVDGSSTVGPIADAFAEVLKAKHGVEITVKKTGSGDGAAALVDGRCDVADMSRFMKDKEFKKAVENGIMPVAHVVAMDGVCVVTHPSNPINAMTCNQIRLIYKGEITNWNQLGGPDRKIVVISRDTSSGTYETFHGLAMNSEKMGSHVEYVNSNAQAHARVKTTEGAIGYVGLGFVDDKVKAVSVDTVMPSRKTIQSGTYPLSRPLFMFTNGYPKLGSLAHTFVTMHLSEEGQDIIEAKGFVPVTSY